MERLTIQEAVQLYADLHPRPIEVTQTQAAQMLRKSRKTINKMVNQGTLRLNENGMIPITEIDKLGHAKAA